MFQAPESAPIKSSKTVLLYGNSILIAGLNQKLKSLRDWKVIHTLKGQPDNLANIELVVIDLRDAGSSHILTIFEEHPHIILVGMDGLTNSLTLLTGQTQPMRTLQDVLDALQQAL